MIKIPNKARFGGIEYTVVLSDDPIRHPDDASVRLNGACLPSQKYILLYNNPYCQTSVEETLIHEALEGMVDTYDMNLDHQTIKTIGVAMHQFLADAKIDFGQSALNTTTH